MTQPAKVRTGRKLFRWLDDFVFTVEQSIVSVALQLITVIVFVDVVARRVTAPDSKVGRLMSRIAGIDDRPGQLWVDQNVAPWVTLVLALLLIGFGVYSSRRFARRRHEDPKPAPFGRELAIAAALAVALVAAAWGFSQIFEQLDSWMVYAGLFSLSGGGYALFAVVRRPEGWPVKAAVGVFLGATLAVLAVYYVPIGYTWSKKVSLMLLLWVGLLSASICVYTGRHIRMEAAQALIPAPARRYVLALGALATAAVCGILTYLGFVYVFDPIASTDEYMRELFTVGDTRYVFGFRGMVGRGGLTEGTDIPDWLGIVSAPVGFGIATLRFLGVGVSTLLGGKYGAPPEPEGLEAARALAMDAPPDPLKSDAESDTKSGPGTRSASEPDKESHDEADSASEPDEKPQTRSASSADEDSDEEDSGEEDSGEEDSDEEESVRR